MYGSDQIWRYSIFPRYEGFDPVLFGEFVPKNVKKITYAASMGIIGDFGEIDFLKSALKNFSAISVRESSLLDFLKKELYIDSILVADPVFLNSKNFWNSYGTSKIRLPKKKYIIFYNLFRNHSFYLRLSKFAKKNNLELIEITSDIFPETLLSGNSKQCISPKDFLFVLKNAYCVFSSSFHGVAFSILFNKNFYALDTGERFGRVKSLLGKLSLENRIIDEKMCFQDFSVTPIEFTIVNEKLKEFKEYSENYIKKNLRK